MQETILVEKKAVSKGKKPELDSFLAQAKACLEDLRAGRVKEVKVRKLSPVEDQLKEGLEDLRSGRVDEV